MNLLLEPHSHTPHSRDFKRTSVSTVNGLGDSLGSPPPSPAPTHLYDEGRTLPFAFVRSSSTATTASQSRPTTASTVASTPGEMSGGGFFPKDTFRNERFDSVVTDRSSVGGGTEFMLRTPKEPPSPHQQVGSSSNEPSGLDDAPILSGYAGKYRPLTKLTTAMATFSQRSIHGGTNHLETRSDSASVLERKETSGNSGRPYSLGSVGGPDRKKSSRRVSEHAREVLASERQSSSNHDDDVLSSVGNKKGGRTTMTQLQLCLLIRLWNRTRYFPSTEERNRLAPLCGLDKRQVQVWFQNNRQKARRIHDSPNLTSDASLMEEPPWPNGVEIPIFIEKKHYRRDPTRDGRSIKGNRRRRTSTPPDSPDDMDSPIGFGAALPSSIPSVLAPAPTSGIRTGMVDEEVEEFHQRFSSPPSPLTVPSGQSFRLTYPRSSSTHMPAPPPNSLLFSSPFAAAPDFRRLSEDSRRRSSDSRNAAMEIDLPPPLELAEIDEEVVKVETETELPRLPSLDFFELPKPSERESQGGGGSSDFSRSGGSRTTDVFASEAWLARGNF